MSYAVVYKIINISNGNFYIGSTTQSKNRYRTHIRLLNANKHHCPHLQAAWNKYGPDSFIFKVVQEVTDTSEVHQFEQQWLNAHHGTPQCYNYAKYTDNSNRGVPRAEPHKVKISVALKEYYKTHAHPMIGKQHSDESKQLMRDNRKGKPVSESHKQKLRDANIGKKASDSTRQKLSEQRKGKPRAESHAAKYNKRIIEVVSGEVFPSLKAVKDRYEMSPGMLAKALAANKPLKRGKCAGCHFRYVDSQ